MGRAPPAAFCRLTERANGMAARRGGVWAGRGCPRRAEERPGHSSPSSALPSPSAVGSSACGH
eukprot:8676156-Alexandrium_andersonii.AAC.1